MRAIQRERRFVCGRSRQTAMYQEVEIYTCSADPAGRRRDREMSEGPPFRGKNPETWEKHNAAAARKLFVRLVNTNFTQDDMHTTLTYSDETLPENDQQAERDVSNFLRHLRAECKKQGFEPPEAIIVTEHQDEDPAQGKKAVRYHHHVLLRCNLGRDDVERCWHRKGESLGFANCDRLKLDKASLEALATYLMKSPNRKHRWRRTRGIRDPIRPRPNDSRYTRRAIQRIATGPDLHSPEFWARKYPGWELNEAEARFNDFWGWSISLKLRRRPERGKDGREH